jgi:hypothetical protein
MKLCEKILLINGFDKLGSFDETLNNLNLYGSLLYGKNL